MRRARYIIAALLAVVGMAPLGGTLAGTATDAHFNLYPLPGSELIANPNLTENPGS
jgi:hypothetical protein